MLTGSPTAAPTPAAPGSQPPVDLPLPAAPPPPPLFLRTVVDNLPDFIYVKDRDSRFVLANAAQAGLLGVASPADAVGKTDFDFFPRELAERYYADEQAVMQSGEPLRGQVERVVDGRQVERWVLTTKVPLRDAIGTVTGLVGISRDVTDQRRAEEELRRANAEMAANEPTLRAALEQVKASHEELIQAQLGLVQAEKLTAVGRMAASVAHEVKNPLAVALLGVDYLAKVIPPGDLRARSVLDVTRDALLRADSIIRGIVNFSSNRQLERASVDLNDVVRQALRLVEHTAAAHGAALVTDLRPGLPRLELDAVKIQQVFVNLVENAVQAMGRGGTVTVRTRAAAGDADGGEGEAVAPRAVVEVEDTGPGIAPENLCRVFQPFFTTKPVGQGTGLGLCVVRNIVELHGGTIDVRNRDEARGVRVTVSFGPPRSGTP